MYMGCCAVLHMQNVVICVPSLNLKLVSNMHFLHHLNQLFLQILVIQGYICTKHSRFCWLVTSGKKRIFWDTASWSSHKGSKGAHAAKTFSRAIKCVLHICHLWPLWKTQSSFSSRVSSSIHLCAFTAFLITTALCCTSSSSWVKHACHSSKDLFILSALQTTGWPSWWV